jgi:hypothetical protein
MLTILFVDKANSGININGEQQYFPYNNCYSNSGGKIYYNKPYNGYYLVKGADAKTFRPLNTVGDNGTTAKDTNHVYFKTKIIPGLKPSETIYVGYNFCKNQHQVFYGDISLKEADAPSFVHIIGYYSADKKHLYYKENIVKEANVNSIRQIKFDSSKDNPPDEYLCDNNHVYYKGGLIKGAKPAQFTYLHIEDDQWGYQYAYDGRFYFYQQNQILVDNNESKTRLKLLTLDKGFCWHGIFYQGTAIYCYDTDNKKLILLGKRDNHATFSAINRGVFTMENMCILLLATGTGQAAGNTA